MLRALGDEHGDAVLLGGGTVTTVAACEAMLAAGAEYIVSPSVHPEVIAATRTAGKLMISGALTPTEIVTAYRAGADIIKVFPCSAVGGADYLRAIHAPFPEIPLIPTGGVTLATAARFLDAGALALGVGSDLVDERAIQAGRPEKVTEIAREYARICVQHGRAGSA